MKQVIDQTAHLIAAIVILLPVALMHNSFVFVWAGFALGLVREVTEDGPIFSKGSILDLSFWTLGGLVAALIHHYQPV